MIVQRCAIVHELSPYTPLEVAAISEQLLGLGQRKTRSAKLHESRPARITDLLDVLTAARRFDMDRQLDFARIREDTPKDEGPTWRSRLGKARTVPRLIERAEADPDLVELLNYGRALAGLPEQSQLSEDLQAASRVIDALLQSPLLWEPRGQPSDNALRDLIHALAAIYEAITGRRMVHSNTGPEDPAGPDIPNGPALDFLRVCVRPLEPSSTDMALQARIRERCRALNTSIDGHLRDPS